MADKGNKGHFKPGGPQGRRDRLISDYGAEGSSNAIALRVGSAGAAHRFGSSNQVGQLWR
jgi:hypothetical protein